MNTVTKELYVAIRAQSWRFRAAKYIIILAIGWGVHYRWGWAGVRWALGIGLVFALAMHFFFRWKSNGWMDDYGPYKSVFKE